MNLNQTEVHCSVQFIIIKFSSSSVQKKRPDSSSVQNCSFDVQFNVHEQVQVQLLKLKIHFGISIPIRSSILIELQVSVSQNGISQSPLYKYRNIVDFCTSIANAISQSPLYRKIDDLYLRLALEIIPLGLTFTLQWPLYP